MRHVDMENWPRREHFTVFNAFDHPHFNMCANVNLTAFYPAVKERGCSINVAIIYVIARASNAVPEFRYRIRDDEVVEHEIVHPSSTIPEGEGLFTFCTMDYYEDFPTFAVKAAERIAYVKEHPTLDDHGRDDLLFMSAIPWVSFTSVMHPMRDHPGDSVPRFAWGKFFEEGESLKMPLGVQAHHALMDGLHMGRFYQEVQSYLDDPGGVLG
ncbi:MAG: chloramphenicol acetyltransferase [Anaerolineae bacterium]|nr:chloramphenicol acetyltransferase [Anaerolineae bacterium]